MDDKDGTSRRLRQLAYSGASLISGFFFCITLTFTDHVRWAIDKEELPFDTLLYVGLSELLKVSCALWLFPTKDLLNPFAESVGTGLTVLGTGDIDCKSVFRLPFSRRDASNLYARTFGKSTALAKVIEIMWGLCAFVLGICICHVILVLFGAPLIQDWKLTLQLSFILVCWLFLPLCLVLRPGSVLSELFYISIWDEQCYPLRLCKWRFLITCIGTWMGAIAFPLDWDRPWQKWPIPCLLSATAAHIIVNVIISIYELYSIFGSRFEYWVMGKRVNKNKVF